MGLSQRERPERFQERFVLRVDVQLAGSVGAHPDPLERDPRLGEPAAEVPQQVFHRPSLREVAGCLRLRGGQGVDQPVDLRPAGVLFAEQVVDLHAKVQSGCLWT